jgi:hypothetical protein
MSTQEDPVIATLDALASEANEQHGFVERADASALEHAIQAGMAILEAKVILGYGELAPWIEANCAFSRRAASEYTRMAFHAEALRAANATTLTAARKVVRGLPAIDAVARSAPRKPFVVPKRAVPAALKRITEARQLLFDVAAADTDPERKQALWDAWDLVNDAVEIVDEARASLFGVGAA